MIKPLKRQKPAFKLSLTQKLLLLTALVLLAFASLPVAIILLIGLLPTITVILTDSQNRNKLTIVGCFNLAGMFVCIVSLLLQHKAGIHINILGNLFNIVVMLGTAALGMVLYYELPNLFIWINNISTQRRLHNIEAKLEKLGEDWGAEAINSSK